MGDAEGAAGGVGELVDGWSWEIGNVLHVSVNCHTMDEAISFSLSTTIHNHHLHACLSSTAHRLHTPQSSIIITSS